MIYWLIEFISKPKGTELSCSESYEHCGQAVRRFVELKRNSTVADIRFYEIEKNLLLESTDGNQ